MSDALIVPVWTFADRIRKVRREVGLSQEEFAERLGSTQRQIASWESGRTEPRSGEMASFALRIQRLFAYPAGWVLGLEPAPHESELDYRRRARKRREMPHMGQPGDGLSSGWRRGALPALLAA